MTKADSELRWRVGAGKVSALGLIAVLAAFLLPRPSFSQTVRVETVSFSSVGGTSSGGSFRLRSAAGESVPAGTTEGGSFIVKSGVISALPFDASAPLVVHTPPGAQPSGQAVRINAAVENVESLESAALHYRRGGDAVFTEVRMTETDGLLGAEIPSDAATSQGLAYFMTVLDQRGRTRRTPSSGVFAVRVFVPEPGITMDEPIPSGNDASAYRIVSIPLDIDDADAESVLLDDLGPYDDTRWRFFELLFDQSIEEFPATTAMEPGKGFWLISSEPERRIDTGAGTSVDLSEAYSLQLHPGWNLVGTPFHFPVAIDNLRLESDQRFILRSFEGSWNDPVRDPVEAMQPFRGYAVFNGLQIVDELLIGPEGSAEKHAGSVSEAGKTAGAGMTAGAGKTAGKSMAADHTWGIHIIAESGPARDVDNLAAVADGARNGLDPADMPEPPTIEAYLSVSFPHPDWASPASRFSADIRSGGEPGYVWDLDIRGDVSEPVDLQFDGVDRVPRSYDVILVDPMLASAQNLRENASYVLAPPEPDEPRRLQLVIGEADFIEQELETAVHQSGTFELLPGFPNPFHSATTIRYVLDEPASVDVRVYDVAGREVAVLAESTSRSAGTHSVVWNGVGNSGILLQSGLYYVRLNASGRVLTTAVVKMR